MSYLANQTKKTILSFATGDTNITHDAKVD